METLKQEKIELIVSVLNQINSITALNDCLIFATHELSKQEGGVA